MSYKACIITDPAAKKICDAVHAIIEIKSRRGDESSSVSFFAFTNAAKTIESESMKRKIVYILSSPKNERAAEYVYVPMEKIITA